MRGIVYTMRNGLFLVLSCIAFWAQGQNLRKQRVLFIGNSYTDFNTLPALTASLAASFSDTLIFDSYAPGGYTFNNHFNDAICISKIAQGNWDYVVLQGQSQQPAFPPQQVNVQSLPYVLKLDSVVRKYNPCALTMMFETWGRKNGDQANCNFYPPLCTYTGMQNRLRSSYKMFADTVKGLMAPVGEAFRASITASPSLELFQADESHPSLEGSYLAACVFYESIFHRSAVGSSLSVVSGSGVQSFLQQKAHETVHDSLSTWNIGIHAPWAEIVLLQNNNPVFQFGSMSQAMTEKWYFGEGTVSSLLNPVFNYTAGGTYTVSHVVSNTCKKDSATIVVSVSDQTGILQHETNEGLRVYPQPCSTLLHVLTGNPQEAGEITISDLQGRILFLAPYSAEIDLHSLPQGFYVLSLKETGRQLNCKFLKD